MEVLAPDEKIDQIMVDLTVIKSDVSSLKTDVSWLKKLFMGGFGGAIIVTISANAGAFL